MTLTEQRGTVHYKAQVHLDHLSDKVCRSATKFLSGSTLAYRKAILCAE